MRKMKMGMVEGFVLGEAEENKDTKLKGRKISWDTDDEETKKKTKQGFTGNRIQSRQKAMSVKGLVEKQFTENVWLSSSLFKQSIGPSTSNITPHVMTALCLAWLLRAGGFTGHSSSFFSF